MTHSVRRAAATTAIAFIGAGLLAGCGAKGSTAADDTTGAAAPATSAGDTATTASSGSTGSSAPVSTSPATSAAATGSGALVYYVTETSLGDRLAAETTPMDGSSALDAALTALLKGKPFDPDYRSLVPGGSLSSPVVHGGVIQVAVTDKSAVKARVGTSPADAKLAIQQVVYTLNAANGTADKPLPVRFVAGRKPSTYLGRPSLEKAAPEPRTVSLMNVYTPAEGDAVQRGVVTFGGVGNSPEANVAWEVRDSSGKAVLKGHSTAAGWMDKDYPWKAKLDLSKLAPGVYTFVASTDDPSEGEGGGPVTDSKRFTLQ